MLRNSPRDDESRGVALASDPSDLAPLVVAALSQQRPCPHCPIPPVWVKLPAVGRPFGRADVELRTAVALGVIATFRPLTEERAIGFIQGWTYCCRRTAQRYLSRLRDLDLLHGLAPDRRYYQRHFWRQTIALTERPSRESGILHHVAMTYAGWRMRQHRRRTNLTYLSRVFRCSRAAVSGWVRRGQFLAHPVLHPSTSTLSRRSRERFPGAEREPMRIGRVLYPIPPPRQENQMGRKRKPQDETAKRKGDTTGVRRDPGGHIQRTDAQKRYGTLDGRPAPGDRCGELMHGDARLAPFRAPDGWKEPDRHTDRLNPKLPAAERKRGKPEKPAVDFWTAFGHMQRRVATESRRDPPASAPNPSRHPMTGQRVRDIVKRRAGTDSLPDVTQETT